MPKFIEVNERKDATYFIKVFINIDQIISVKNEKNDTVIVVINDRILVKESYSEVLELIKTHY